MDDIGEVRRCIAENELSRDMVLTGQEDTIWAILGPGEVAERSKAAVLKDESGDGLDSNVFAATWYKPQSGRCKQV